MDYQQALGRAGRSQVVSHSGGRRRYAHFSRRGDEVAVRLFETEILVFLPDDSVVINTGGYNTATTREALNALLPTGLRVGTTDRQLFLYGAGDLIAVTDGMRVRPGRVLATGRPVPADMRMRRPRQHNTKRIAYRLDRDTGLMVSQLDNAYAWPVIDFGGMGPEDGFQLHYELELITGVGRRELDSLGELGAAHVPPELRLVHEAFWAEHRRRAPARVPATAATRS